jgi:hypothetical protein
VILSKSLQVWLDGLLHLHDHLGFVEKLIRGRQYLDADITEVLIRIATLFAGAALDEDVVAAANQFDTGRRNKSDSPLAGFQLTRYANTHGCPVNMSFG